MKDEFREYLNNIGIISLAIHKRIEEILKLVKEIHSEEINDLFLGEYFNQEGVRIFPGLGLYSDNFCTFATDFLNENNFAVHSLKEKIVSLDYFIDNYNFKETTEKSRLRVIIKGENGNIVQGRATGNNCNKLKEAVDKYFLPRLNI